VHGCVTHEYPWSSHHAYCGIERFSWFTTEFGLGLWSKTMDGAHRAYQLSISGNDCSIAEADQKLLPSSDSRVIGTDRFLASLPPPRVQPKSLMTLEELAKTVCAALELSLERVRSTSRERSLTKARVMIARRAVEEHIVSMHEVAGYLQRSPASLGQLLKRHNVG